MSDAITSAVRLLGGPSATARLLGITPGAVSQLVSGHRATPAERCPAIERSTDGRVPVEQLRPDVRWVRVPDAAWPHPQGRPCIDVTEG